MAVNDKKQNAEKTDVSEGLKDSPGKSVQTMVGAVVAIGTLIALLVSNAQSENQNKILEDQNKILATQLAHEMSQPVLEGRYVYTTGPRNDLEDARSEIINELFDAMFELAASNPGVPYSQLVEKALPISHSISPVPVVIVATVENTGDNIATGVSVCVDWVGEITELDVDALSEWQISDGGVGEKRVIVSIERISKREEVEISVEYAPIDAADTLELTPLLEFTSIPGGSTPPYSRIAARISSNETPEQELSWGIPEEEFFQRLMSAPSILGSE